MCHPLSVKSIWFLKISIIIITCMSLTSHFIQSVQQESYQDCCKCCWSVWIGQKWIRDNLTEKVNEFNYYKLKLTHLKWCTVLYNTITNFTANTANLKIYYHNIKHVWLNLKTYNVYKKPLYFYWAYKFSTFLLNSCSMWNIKFRSFI